MKARVFQPFAKVWTPRTPDSSYDSFAGLHPPPAFVYVTCVGDPTTDPPTVADFQPDQVGSGVSLLETSTYLAGIAATSRLEQVGGGVTLFKGTYTP